MEVLKVCRICLNMDVKLHDLRSYPLESYYESVIGTNPLYTNLPPQKCLRSLAVLYGVTDDYRKLKPHDIKAIDRQSLHMTSNLATISMPAINIPNLQADNQIKLKPDNEQSEVGKLKNNYDLLDHDYTSFNSMDHVSSDDDDKLLSLHNEEKSQASMKEEYENLEFAVGTNGKLEDTIEVPQALERTKKQQLRIAAFFKPRKEKPNPKRDDNMRHMEQYITVISLTLEEQIEEMQKRKESSNYLNSPHQCNLCYKGFVDDDVWKHHVRKHAAIHSGDNTYECEICGVAFNQLRSKTLHVRTVHTKEPPRRRRNKINE